VASDSGTVAVIWRGDPAADPSETRNHGRLLPVFDALTELGIGVVSVLYRDDVHDAVRDRLLDVDGVLVWVDPIGAGEDRTTLDTVLRDASSRGVWVSTHPDTIEKMGTKAVLHRTRELSWGSDTRLYSSPTELREGFPQLLSLGRPRVLKHDRSNGGLGVWRVTPPPDPQTATVSVQHAAPRDDSVEVVTLDDFMDRCDHYFEGGGKLVDQPFMPRIADGLIRAYLVEATVVGFARQQPAEGHRRDRVLGLPSSKTMFGAGEPDFAVLRRQLEDEWVPGLRRCVDLAEADLPVLWDADFLLGPPTTSGQDTYALCEINVSSVLPFPPSAPPLVARAVRTRLDDRR